MDLRGPDLVWRQQTKKNRKLPGNWQNIFLKLKIGGFWIWTRTIFGRLTFEYLLKSILNRIGKKATFEDC